MFNSKEAIYQYQPSREIINDSQVNGIDIVFTNIKYSVEVPD